MRASICYQGGMNTYCRCASGRSFDFSVARLRNRNIPQPVRVFKEFAEQMARKPFPTIPS
jgi:hypothetical protein